MNQNNKPNSKPNDDSLNKPSVKPSDKPTIKPIKFTCISCYKPLSRDYRMCYNCNLLYKTDKLNQCKSNKYKSSSRCNNYSIMNVCYYHRKNLVDAIETDSETESLTDSGTESDEETICIQPVKLNSSSPSSSNPSNQIKKRNRKRNRKNKTTLNI
jgi:hypothetical protein